MLNDLTNEKSLIARKLLESTLGTHVLIYGQDAYSRQLALSSAINTIAKESISSFAIAARADYATILSSQLDSLDKEIIPWDISSQKGIPFRTSISSLGPFHLSRILELNAVQEGVLRICYRLEREEGYLLLDLSDLQSLLSYINRHPDELSGLYGSISSASVAAIMRRIIRFQDEYGDDLFGTPALDTRDLLSSVNGKGLMHLLYLDAFLSSSLVASELVLFILEQFNESLRDVREDKLRYVLCFDQVERIFSRVDLVFLDRFTALMDELAIKGVKMVFLAANAEHLPKVILERILDQEEADFKQKPKLGASYNFDENHEFYRNYKKRVDIESAKTKLAAQVLSSKASVQASSKSKPSSALKKMTDAAAATIGREIGRNLVRGIFDKFKRF